MIPESVQPIFSLIKRWVMRVKSAVLGAIYSIRNAGRKWPIVNIFVLGVLVVIYSIGYAVLSKVISTRSDEEFAPKSDWGLVPAESFNPKKMGAGIDIIFVHGLGSNPDTTWLGRNKSYVCALGDSIDNNPCDSLAGKEYINWVTDLFHNDLPLDLQTSTRAFFYNYDSYWFRDGIEERLARIGHDLFERVVAISTKDSGRMFVFVGHSYGGLVIKEAVLEAQAYQKHRSVNIFQQTQAIVFMGTPHRGSAGAKYSAIFARMLKFFWLHSVPEILEAIRYDSNELRDMHRRFEAISQDLMLVNFYETVKLRELGGYYSEYAVSEASATLDRPNVQNLGLHTNHTGLNKYWRRDSDYKRVSSTLISLMETIFQKGRSTKSIYVIPPDLANEYTERDELYSNIRESLREPGNIVAAIGLGGMGKTQLALRYAKKHKGRYDIILWIDARSETAILSSFHRCARALNILPESADSTEGLRDNLAVGSVLQWLQRRDDQHGESLLIFDHLDEWSNGVMRLIPTKLHGSIIITSRNTQCLTALPKKSRQINVGDMTPLEAESLFIRYLNLNTTEVSKDIRDLSRQVCDAMHWSALAIHLAGTQLRMTFAGRPYNNLSETKTLLERFLRDIRSHKDDILKAQTVKGKFDYDLNVDTVLDASLKAIDQTFPNLPSRRLLIFFANIEAIDIPDNLFWYVARAIAEGQYYVARNLPRWLKDLLAMDEDGRWDDFKIREALKPLWQYGLVKSTHMDGSTQISMHDLVRWKAKLDGEESQQEELPWDLIQALFYASAVRQVWFEHNPSPASVEILDFTNRNAPGAKAFLSAPIDRTDLVLDMIGEVYELGPMDRRRDAEYLWRTLTAGLRLDAAVPEYNCNTLARRVNSLVFWDDPLTQAIRDLVAKCIANHQLTYTALREVERRFNCQGQYEKAQKVILIMIDKGLRIWNQEDDARFDIWELAKVYIKQKRWDDAKAILKEIIWKEGEIAYHNGTKRDISRLFLYQTLEAQRQRKISA